MLDELLLNLRPAALLRTLTADYLHALLCEAALSSFAAENEARMEAMAAARNQIEGGDHGQNHRTRGWRGGDPCAPSLTQMRFIKPAPEL
ncbi:hypothetical protein [Rhodopila sp.]|uniref:hypothetical protein n=1 Tax=Rhodopila sp. TaxID=2480087 RepID=UPI003D0BA4DB